MVGWVEVFLAVQAVAAWIVGKRLLPGRKRLPPLTALPAGVANANPGSVTLVIPARNEAKRIGDCLSGAVRQGSEVSEILVIDDESTDNTVEVSLSFRDGRLRVIRGQPLPRGWVGKAWALEQGLQAAKTEWVLCLDADTRPGPGLVASFLRAAREQNSDLLFVGPRFIVDAVGVRFLHPALMTTLVYRLGPGDAAENGGRTRRQMISGPCFLYRTEVIRKNGGFVPAKAAFAEDAVMAAHLSKLGHSVSFRNGAPLLDIKMYGSMRETWAGWGVSLALSEMGKPWERAGDVAVLALTQALPLPVLVVLAVNPPGLSMIAWTILGLNLMLFALRLIILREMTGSYKDAKDVYWLSPLADGAAVLRILLSAVSTSRSWRGRSYGDELPDE